MNRKKQNLGQFNTKNDVWLRPHIVEFIGDVGAKRVVDPFAGAGDLLFAADDKCDVDECIGYDIDPDFEWPVNDGLVDIPHHSDAMVITNPPYLAKNSATRNDFDNYKYFSGNGYEDLYQLAIYRVLAKYNHAVFIIPETFFQSKFFKEYVYSYTVIEDNPFIDTDCPVCVVCFHKDDSSFLIHRCNNFGIYKNDEFLFFKETLDRTMFDFNFHRLCDNTSVDFLDVDIVFNDPKGNLGLRGVDGVNPCDRICFCKPEDLDYEGDIKDSSRAITLIGVHNVVVNDVFLNKLNYFLEKLRVTTHDVVLSPFKNNNKLGQRRRRLDFRWARKIIEKSICNLDK